LKQENDGKLTINTDALSIIEKLEGNIAVCSVVGPYRSGKSFINNLLLNRQDGFQLGSTVRSCTRGLWIWSKPIKYSNKFGEFNLIIIDTEGLAAPTATKKLDSQIFVLSILLSSYLVYNTKNVID
jgi:hypothetical protein